MLRTLALLLPLLSLSASASSEIAPNSVDTLFAAPHTENRLLHSVGMSGPHLSAPLAQSRCKICTVGKAYGNTCISHDKACHVGPGCACDG
jgi:hypothetical protein